MIKLPITANVRLPNPVKTDWAIGDTGTAGGLIIYVESLFLTIWLFIYWGLLGGGNNLSIKFCKVSDFDRGTLFNLLKDAYAYDPEYEKHFLSNWRECDDFFYDNINIADKCCVVTSIYNKAIGFVCWDPRNIPEYVEIGHNCIAQELKGLKYGKLQLKEAISRIKRNSVKRIIVTTNESLFAARKNYESVGFNEIARRDNDSDTKFSGAYIYYEIICEVLEN